MTARDQTSTSLAEPVDMSSLPPQTIRSLRFWGIFTALCLLSFISALDVAIITTSLPTITANIGGANQYVWIANSFVVASSVLQPLVGQLADILGRRVPFVTSVTLFAVGSGIAGGAYNVGMLISGRTIQGVGAGGIYLLLSIVCCDLVPLRERGKYLALMNACAGVAAAVGPVIGGLIAQRNWRWIFYLNIPICGVSLAVLLLFMRMKSGGATGVPLMARITRLDWLGNIIFTPSMIAVLFGLVMGGVQFPWDSWHILVPLILGVCGWAAFHIQQYFAANPSIPSRLFSNRTSAIGYILTFFSSVLVQAQSYFLPLYFQAALGHTVLESGTDFLPFAIGTLGFAVISGVLLSKFGAYRPLHATAFACSAVGFGLLTLLDGNIAKVGWVFFELIASAGAGLVLSVLLPAIMAALPEGDVASASAAFAFMKTFGYVWGVTVPSIIFNAVVDNNLYLISSPTLQNQLRDGGAYAFASQMHLLRDELSPETWSSLVLIYTRGLRVIWWLGLGISVACLFGVGLERGLELRKMLNTDYGIDEKVGVDEGTSEGSSSAVVSAEQPKDAK
ncbi:MFS general substrate transporter [Hypoxylon cercidicola]|nr:MFS general substrate transporter [Hypoxylon cercidicola]